MTDFANGTTGVTDGVRITLEAKNPVVKATFWMACPLRKQLSADARFGEGDLYNETYLVSGVVFDFLRLARWMYSAARPHTIPTPRGL